MAENKSEKKQKTEDRGQKTEDRGQKTEVRGQKSEDRKEEKSQRKKEDESKQEVKKKEEPEKESQKEGTKKKETKKAEEPEEELEITDEMQKIIQFIEKMNIMELSKLVKVLEKKFGVSAIPAMAPAAGVATGTETGKEEEEKDIYDVVLTEVGAQKIQVIKEIRGITTLGLKEAKDLVESVPKAVKESVSKEEAEEVKSKLEGVGAKVELK